MLALTTRPDAERRVASLSADLFTIVVRLCLGVTPISLAAVPCTLNAGADNARAIDVESAVKLLLS